MHDPDVLVWNFRLFEVWHREPRNADSGTICDLASRRRHPHHWWLNSMPLRQLRRRVLTRCAGCGGRDTKRDPVNIRSRNERGERRWWRGEPHLFHHRCFKQADNSP